MDRWSGDTHYGLDVLQISSICDFYVTLVFDSYLLIFETFILKTLDMFCYLVTVYYNYLFKKGEKCDALYKVVVSRGQQC